MKESVFDLSLKKIGLVHLNSKSVNAINSDVYTSYIKILYLPKGCKIKVDFDYYSTSGQTLFFISPNKSLNIERLSIERGYLLYYNSDFYCIQIHDDEVACDGLLFNNVNNMPMTLVPQHEVAFVNYLISSIEDEFELKDYSQEEMIRTYLKQLLIKSTRFWKLQHLDNILSQHNSDLEFFRHFTRLVEANYKEKHTVADYADLLMIAPKTLTHKLKRLDLPQPNEVIKSRIILEAKRLLVYTTRSTKEIAYGLGYNDPAYFSRLFLIKTGESPSSFRSKYLTQNHVETANIEHQMSS